MSVLYVVTWRYSDGSASGTVSAHRTEACARQMLDILENNCSGMRQFDVKVTPADIDLTAPQVAGMDSTMGGL